MQHLVIRTRLLPSGSLKPSTEKGYNIQTDTLAYPCDMSGMTRIQLETMENQTLLNSYQRGLAILRQSGIQHVMPSKNRADSVLKQWSNITATLCMVTPFNYMRGTEMPPESNLLDADVIPSHIWFVACLLTGDSPTATVFKTVIKKWQAIKEMLRDNEIDDVSGTTMIMDPLRQHARGAAKKYGWLLRMDQETRFNKPRLEGIELWMDALHIEIQNIIHSWLIKRDCRVAELENELLLEKITQLSQELQTRVVYAEKGTQTD